MQKNEIITKKHYMNLYSQHISTIFLQNLKQK